jgi:hypothetical protein
LYPLREDDDAVMDDGISSALTIDMSSDFAHSLADGAGSEGNWADGVLTAAEMRDDADAKALLDVRTAIAVFSTLFRLETCHLNRSLASCCRRC